MTEGQKEVEPPWIYAPEYEPGRAFWRQEGEAWFLGVWLPYWEGLNGQEREEYLKRWNAPEEWLKYSYHINPEYKEWVDSLDSPALRFVMSSDSRVNGKEKFSSVSSSASLKKDSGYQDRYWFKLIMLIGILFALAGAARILFFN